MKDPIKIAQERFSQGFNCSQSVFSAFAADLGLSDEAALKLTSPFGGGVAHQGQICGAVTGALMVLGLGKGEATLEAKDQNYVLPEEFVKRFQERNGTLLCRDLIGYDISNQDELQAARESGVFKSSCPGYVKAAAELVSAILND